MLGLRGEGIPGMTAAIEPITRPDIIVPDTTPLIHLALAGLLPLLHQLGGTVVLVDVVADEATRDLSKPGAEDLARWIAHGVPLGSNHPIRVERTETGQALDLARQTDPAFRAPNAGEAAVIEWLATTVQGTDRSIIVLYENGRVPGIIANQGMSANIAIITIRGFLKLAEGRGLIPSAGAAWEAVLAAAPTANPRILASSQRRR